MIKLPILKSWQGTLLRWSSELQAFSREAIPPQARPWDLKVTQNGSPTFTSVNVRYADYFDYGTWIEVDCCFSGTFGGVAGRYVDFTLPVKARARAGQQSPMIANTSDGTDRICGVVVPSEGEFARLINLDGSNWATAGGMTFRITGRYRP